MIKKLLTGKISSIASAAIVISAAGLASRVLGVVRDRVLAGQFGAGAELDMYYAAFRVPDLVYNLIVLGALSAGFIPIFTGLLKNEAKENYSDNKKAWDLVNSVVNVFFVALVIICSLLFIFVHKLVPLITPGFTASQLAVTINLTRLMFLSPIFLGISGIFGGVLQSFKRFFIYSLAPIMYNLGIIFGALFFVDLWGVYGLAIGVIVGAFLHLMIQVPMVFKLGFRYKLLFRYKDKNLIEIFKLMVPRILALATAQINLFVVTILGSTLAAGSIAVYNFATNLQSFPVGLIGISFAIAAFPTLSAYFAKNNEKEFKNKLQQTFRLILFAIIPLTVLLLILRIQITRVILGSGQFDWHDTILTADSLGLFSLSLFAQALIPLLARAFYARHNTMVPFVAGLLSAIINVFLSWILIDYFSVLGLALAFSISQIINFIILFVFLRLYLGSLQEIQIIKSFCKVGAASFVMGLVIQALKYPLSQIVNMQKLWGIFLQGFLAGIAGIIVFIILCKIFKCQEFDSIVSGVKRRLFKKVELKSEGIREVEH